MELPKYVYSLDGEWYDDFDTVQEEVNSDYEKGETCCGYKGVPIAVNHADYVRNLPNIQDLLQEIACEDDGEKAECYLDDMTEEMGDNLNDLIVDFLNKNCKEPDYYNVDIVEDFVFISED